MAKRLAAGVYAEDGTLLIDAGELLREHGWPDTPKNRERLAQAAREMAASRGIEYAELHREHEGSGR